MSDDAVILQQISKRYGSLRALHEVSLRVPRGGFYGLLGPNGAGKTTLIGILGGLVRADGGSGTVLGRDIAGESLEVRKQIGIVPQEALYDPFFKVREALVFQSKYYGLHRNEEWIDTLLHKLQLQDKIHTNTRALSGGMKRRLMIAQALVHKPPLIVLDEPTAGVDINLRLSLWTFIRELNAAGHTIILTTHYLEEAEALCDHIALMHHGEVAWQGSTRALLTKAAHAVQVRIRARRDTPLPPLPQVAGEVSEAADHSRLHTLASPHDIEPLLAAYREAGTVLEEVAIAPPRLEDAFVQLLAAK